MGWTLLVTIGLVFCFTAAPFILAFTSWAPAPNRQSYRRSDHPEPYGKCSHPKGWTHSVDYTLTESTDGSHFKGILVFCGCCHCAFFKNPDDAERASPESILSAKAYAGTQGFEYRDREK